MVGDVPYEFYKTKDDIFPVGVAREEKTLGRNGTFLLGFSIPDTHHVVWCVSQIISNISRIYVNTNCMPCSVSSGKSCIRAV